MGTVNVTLGDGKKLNLILGQQLENAVTAVVFDFSAWQTEFGSGTLGLSVQRHGDTQPYAVVPTVSGTNATWNISELDTAYKGVGEVQVTYTVGSVVKKSTVYKFTVYRSLGENGEYPSPGQTWQEEIEDELADVKQDLFSETVISNNRQGFVLDTGEFNANANWVSLFVPINMVLIDGCIKIIRGTLYPYSNIISSMAFFDSEMNLLFGSKYNQPQGTVWGYADIPEGATYVAFNSSNYSAGFDIAVNSLYSQISSNTVAVNDMRIKTISLSGSYNGQFQYKKVFLHKGDKVKIKATYNGGLPYIWFSDGKRDDSSVPQSLIDTSKYNKEIIVADNCWAGFTGWAASESGNKSWAFTITIISKYPFVDKKESIIVAPSDGSFDDKLIADLVCDGTNDGEEINKAIYLAQCTGANEVLLCDGNYYIDSYTEYNIYGVLRKVAICVHHARSLEGITIRGVHEGKPQNAIINVQSSIFESLGSDDILSIFSGGAVGTGYQGGHGFNVKNLWIKLPDSQHKVIAINYQWCYWGIIENCFIQCNGYGQDVVPVENCIGVRGWAGWSDGIDIGIKDVFTMGFYVGFQMGGEHAILERCGTRYNYYAYTFGEYPLEANSGAQVHPITLINCCDEHSAALPKFSNSGNANSRGAGRCAVDMISFNIEAYPLISEQPLIGATEAVDGGWVGRIDYTIENNENNSSVTLPFWADGHGSNFRSTNSAQKEIGTTALRRTYAPNYMQKYYDEDLNKVVFCIDPSTKKWVDGNGSVVD